MPRLKHILPKLRKHSSGRAFVELGGIRTYLGAFGSAEAQEAYDRLIGQWVSQGRPSCSPADTRTTVTEVLAAFWDFAQIHFRKNGRLTDEVACYRSVIRHLRDLYGSTPADEFGAEGLRAVRQKMVDAGNCRSYVNKQVKRVRRLFKWAASDGLVSAEVYSRLKTVDALQAGRTTAKDYAPVRAVPEHIVDLTLKHCSPTVRDMIGLQRLTGCRPEEICKLQASDIDRSDDVWLFIPPEHKMLHTGSKRVVPIGGKGQAILAAYLERFPVGPLFRDTRGRAFHSDSYRRAVHRACEQAFRIPAELKHIHRQDVSPEIKKVRRERLAEWKRQFCWNPNQIRHLAATKIARQFSEDAARTILGHGSTIVTRSYLDPDVQTAKEVARRIG